VKLFPSPAPRRQAMGSAPFRGVIDQPRRVHDVYRSPVWPAQAQSGLHCLHPDHDRHHAAALFWSWVRPRHRSAPSQEDPDCWCLRQLKRPRTDHLNSFSGGGLKAGGSGLSPADLFHPGRIAQVGLDAARPLLTSISGLMGYVSFFDHFIQIAAAALRMGDPR
jgi:hypothetical protein